MRVQTGLVGVLMMLIFLTGIMGCGSSFRYDKYFSKDALLNVSMDQLSGWAPRETRGAGISYIQVSFIPPADFRDAIISLTIKDTAHVGGKADLEIVANDLLAKRKQFAAFNLAERETGFLLKQPAVIFDMAYKMPLSYEYNKSLVLVREKILIARVKDHFYFFRYQNVFDQFSQFVPAFDHMATSLRFKN